MTETRWWAYLQGLMGTQTQQQAAEKIGISKSNITRWKAGARADPDFVVKVARAYGTNVLEALVASEFITEEEAALTEVSPTLDLTKIDGALLAEELDRRIRILNYLKDLSSNSTPDIDLGATVTELASVRKQDTDDGTVRDWTDHAHAADSSPDEDALREEYGGDPLD